MFIGRYKIESETPINEKYVTITFERIVDEKDGEKIDFLPMPQIFSTKMLEKVKTEEINNDLTALREKRCADLIQTILALFLDENVYIDEVSYIFEQVHNQIKRNAQQASHFRWGVEDYNVTMYHINDALSEYLKKQDTEK